MGDHTVSTHFPKDPNGDLCRMTKTTRARCTSRPLKRADGISQPTSLGDLKIADQKILNLGDGSSFPMSAVVGSGKRVNADKELLEAAMARAREEGDEFLQAVSLDETMKERQAELFF